MAKKAEKINAEAVKWLVAGDIGPTCNLDGCNEATIRAALDELKSNPGNDHSRELILKRQLKKLLETQGEQVAATETRQARAVTMDMTTLQAERDQQQAEREEQTDKETRIAESYIVAGRIQAMTFVEKVLAVSTLVQLKNIKSAKTYRDLPGIGTWDKYCEFLGFSRQKVDMDLQNLAEFGEHFLQTVGSFGLGYRELRQLRQLKYDGESFQMSDDGKTVVIEGEAIALGEDAGAEIEAALEKLLEKNKTLRERNTRLEKDLKGAVKEEVAGLAAEKKALLERVKTLEVFEPKADDREWAIKGMERIEEAAAALQLAIAGFLIDEHVSTDRHIQARVDAHLREAEMALHDVRTRLDDTIGMFND